MSFLLFIIIQTYSIMKKLKDSLSFGKVKDDYFYFEKIEKYFKNKDHSDAFQTISDKTCKDLDFEELFMFLDRTNSKVGQQYLYNRLRNIPNKSVHNENFEKIIRTFVEDPKIRKQTQKQLDRLKKDEAYYISSLFQEENIKPPKWFFIVPILSFTSLLSLLLLPFNTKLIFIVLCTFIINLAIHFWNKKNLGEYTGSIPQLLKLKNIAFVLFKEDLFKSINPQLLDSIKILNQIRNRMAFFQLEAKIQGDMEAVFWSALELIKIIFLLEPLLLFGVLKRLETKKKAVEEVFSFVGQIDSLYSIASLRKGLVTFCFPNITEKEITAKNIYHPLINNCTSNSIKILNKSILLTGSNMSGKTSFIRSIGINTITGLTINTCFAEELSIPKSKIYSAIRISDDLMNDKSYYFEEVLTIKEMIDNSTKNESNIFLLDEIFKGTNTVERISAGKAILSTLVQNNNMVFVSTHDIELTDLLSEEYDLYHFSEIVNDNNVDFDYKLKEGKLKNRNAIRILQLNDYPKSVINEAIKVAQKLDSRKELKSVLEKV